MTALRRALTLLAGTALAVMLVTLAGCDEAALRPLAQQAVYDLRQARFVAEREFECEVDGQKLAWREKVRSAGDGVRIVVDLLTRNGSRRDQLTDPAEVAAFDRLAAHLRAGGGRRALFQRDPIPDDVDRIAANYYISLVQLGREPVHVRGEPSLTYLLDPIWADRPFYVLTVSTARGHEGFPLECQEYVQDVTGPRLVSTMAVKSLKWDTTDGAIDPPTDPVRSVTRLQSLDAARDRAAHDGLRLLLPADPAVPPGFELARIDEIELDTDATPSRQVFTLKLWRFVYSDGIERIEFLEHVPLDSLPQAFLGNPLRDLALTSRFGSVSSGTVLHQGTQVTIESRVAADRFVAMLRGLVGI